MKNILTLFLLTVASLDVNAVFQKHPRCVFPFNYQGRVYDDCITSDAAAPWCSSDKDYKGIFHYCNNNQGDAMEASGAFLSAQRKLTENSLVLQNTTYTSGTACETCGTSYYIVESSMSQLVGISHDNNRHIDFLLNVENENAKDVLNINFEDVKDYLVCPNGWYSLSDTECYHFSPGKSLSDARVYCESKGASVMTVNSIEENNLITAKAQELYANEGSILIGITDDGHEGDWQWLDDSDSKFTNWNSGEPNNANGNENCVLIYLSNGKWNDVPCYIKANAVCRGHILYARQ